MKAFSTAHFSIFVFILTFLSAYVFAVKVDIQRWRKVVPSLSSSVTQTSYLRPQTKNIFVTEYFLIAPLYIGLPTQKVFVSLNTGFADLVLYGEDYVKQFPDPNLPFDLAPPYNSTMSSTFLSNDSTLEGFYDALNGDNATVEVSTERITFEGLTLDKQPFGLILGGNWFPGPFVSGTLGLGFEGNSFLNATPPVQQLFFSKAFKEPVFTFALSRPSITSVTSKGGYAVEAGGKFTIGEIDQTQYKGNIGWSPLISTNPKSVGPTEWAAKLDKITVNEVTLPEFEDLIAVFDTAISGTYVSDALFNTIFAQVKDSFIEGSDDPDARSDSSAYVACGDGLAPVFNLTMSMGGVSIPINPMDLIERSPQYNLDGKEFCPTTFSSMNDTKVSLILGQEVLSSLLTIFSFDPPRIGIAAQSDRINNNSNQSNGFETVQIYSTSEVTRPTSTNFTQTTLPTVFASATTHFQKVGSTTINVGGSFAGGTLSIESITMATVIPMSSNGAVPIFSKNKTYSIYILVASFHFTVIFVTVVMTL